MTAEKSAPFSFATEKTTEKSYISCIRTLFAKSSIASPSLLPIATCELMTESSFTICDFFPYSFSISAAAATKAFSGEIPAPSEVATDMSAFKNSSVSFTVFLLLFEHLTAFMNRGKNGAKSSIKKAES